MSSNMSDAKAALRDARMSFDRRRDEMVDEAVHAHARGDEDRAEKLLHIVKNMQFRGLEDG